jgi:hypothetical protein
MHLDDGLGASAGVLRALLVPVAGGLIVRAVVQVEEVADRGCGLADVDQSLPQSSLELGRFSDQLSLEVTVREPLHRDAVGAHGDVRTGSVEFLTKV